MLNSAATSTARLPRLSVSHRDLDAGVRVIAVQGEVDLASAPALKSALLELVADEPRRLVLDLSQVGYMDSTGLGVLVGVQRRLGDGAVIAIGGAPRVVAALFELTGLDRTFKLVADVDSAVAELGAPASARAGLSTDAALVLGLVATAIPFADGRAAEAERWLRVLRLHGDAGRILSTLGLGEALLAPIPPALPDEDKPDPLDAVTAVSDHAAFVAAEHGSATVGTADLLAGVIAVYGEDFDRVLEAHGCAPDELAEQLSAAR
jgi:anti-sigma B factor antagonist